MKRFVLLLVLAGFSRPAQGVFLDCLFIDSLEGEAATAPVNWKPLLAVHNCARKTVLPRATPNLGVLRWNATIAAAAQAYANNCLYQHNTSTPYGENLYAGAVSSGFPANVEIAAANDWAAEFTSYNYAANSCSGVCGHYTQMVWRTTTEVGCGIRQCTANSPFQPPFTNWTLVVCNYSPAGNIGGARPY